MVLALRFRRPRPRRRHLMRQPGAVACFSMVVGCVLALVPFALRHLFEVANGSPWSQPIDVEKLLLFGPPVCGSTVLGSWTSLLLRAGWRPEPSWVDRAGRLLGLFWIGTVTLAIESFAF